MNAIVSLSYEDSLKARYAVARTRLNRGIVAPVVVNPPPSPPPAPPEEEEAAPAPAKKIRFKERVPLDMLRPCSWRFLLRLASIKHRIPEQTILGSARMQTITEARHDAIAMVYQHTQLSMPAVGRFFGKDHTTVLHALRKLGRDGKLVEKKPLEKRDAPPKAAKADTPKPKPPVKKERMRTALQNAVARAYNHNVAPSVLAEAYGCNPNSVRVIAHRLGLKRSDFKGKHKTAWLASGREVAG